MPPNSVATGVPTIVIARERAQSLTITKTLRCDLSDLCDGIHNLHRFAPIAVNCAAGVRLTKRVHQDGWTIDKFRGRLPLETLSRTLRSTLFPSFPQTYAAPVTSH
jgi:hypothetical protein